MTEDREAPDSRPDAEERSTVDDAEADAESEAEADAESEPDADATEQSTDGDGDAESDEQSTDGDADDDGPSFDLDGLSPDDLMETDAVIPGFRTSSDSRDRPWLDSNTDAGGADAADAADGTDADAADGTDADAADGTDADAADDVDVTELNTWEADSAGAAAEETTQSGAATAESIAADGTTVGDRAGGAIGDLGQSGPEEDVEMPLTDHIEEMMSRLGIVFLIGGVVTLAVFPMAEDLINHLWNAHIPGAATIADRRPRLYGPLELLLTKLKVAALAGLLAGLPVLVYQSYRFMRPGLYPRERRYYLAAVPTSLILGIIGVSFAHFIVLPAIFAYFTSYTTGTALVAFGLRETFNLILLLMGYMAIVFQIPLFIMLGIMMGLVTRRWLESKRLLFWGAFLGISFLVSPDPTGMAPIIVTVTMITLYEGTLALLRWTGN